MMGRRWGDGDGETWYSKTWSLSD